MAKQKKEIFKILLSVILIILILLIIIVSLSKVKLEGNCKIDNFSFDINKTNNNIENLSLSNGEIACSFKLESPLWVILIGA